MLTGAQLAGELGLSRARISQYVSEGKLTGCYSGEGRARRFDREAVAVALGRRLDAAQMLGNGAETRRALAAMQNHVAKPVQRASKPSLQGVDTRLVPNDLDNLQLVNTQLKEEALRDARRKNAVAEKTYLLASEVELQITRLIEQEITEFETVLRDGARRVADTLKVDFRTTRQILVETWRAHRKVRSDQSGAQAGSAGLTEAERDEDI